MPLPSQTDGPEFTEAADCGMLKHALRYHL